MPSACASEAFTHGWKLAGARSGNVSARLPMSPFGSMISAGMPASSASSSRTIARPVLPEPVMPTMTPCVVRSLEPTTRSSLPGLARRRVDDLAEVERAAICHGAESMTTCRRRIAPMIDRIRVDPGTKPHLAKRDAGDHLGLERQGARARAASTRSATRLETLQQRLYAEGRHAVLLVLQGLDASGKDGVIRTVFEGVNPQSCRVASFKAPTSTELAHDYLWRVHAVAAGARRDRDLQPLALRGRRRRADARARAGEGLEARAPATSSTGSGCSSTRARRS